MKKVPITEFINSWLEADIKLAEMCKEEICEYHSDSAYRGYALGYEAGVNTQMVKDDDVKMCLLNKYDIISAKRNMTIADCSKYVTEDDCRRHISNSEEYWFMAGAMWLLDHLKKQN